MGGESSLVPIPKVLKLWQCGYVNVSCLSFEMYRLSISVIFFFFLFWQFPSFRVFCEPRTPFVASRVCLLKQGRPPLCSSTLGSCWTRASSTNLNLWSFAGLSSSREENSFWRSGSRKTRYSMSDWIYAPQGNYQVKSNILFIILCSHYFLLLVGVLRGAWGPGEGGGSHLGP